MAVVISQGVPGERELRSMPMVKREVTVRFLTPAFLGDAQQNGQWRTPPFKALLRQWWRVCRAAGQGFKVDVTELRRAESALFGAAADQGTTRSLVRLRLGGWRQGGLQGNKWPGDRAVAHPEVRAPTVGSALYLGYGPLTYRNRRTTLKGNAAIQAGEENTLLLGFPSEHAPLLDQSLALMHAFGTLGGRSRNGWGSLDLGVPLTGPDVPVRPWKACLVLDWPHAIGCDDAGPLVWTTAAHADWPSLMQTLARLKIGFRTAFPFRSGTNAPQPEDRHWLSHPVTNHNVGPWGQARLPNSLRFKVRAAEGGGLVGVVFHMPHLPPARFQPDRRSIESVWTTVHCYLDGEPGNQLGLAREVAR